MILKIFIEDEELKLAYIEQIEKHNQKILGSKFPDAGFDLLTPELILYNKGNKILKLDFKIKCSAEINGLPVSYYIYPRSSLATKTNLRFANSVGIIDSGYRGNISGVFDLLIFHPYKEYNVEQYSRLVQICAPDLRPILVQLVDLEKDLSEETERKYGGFGSTG